MTVRKPWLQPGETEKPPTPWVKPPEPFQYETKYPWGDLPPDEATMKLISKRGIKRTLPKPEDVLRAGDEYLAWCVKNPLEVQKTAVSNGKLVKYTEKRNRPPTKLGFARFLGVDARTVDRLVGPDKEPEYQEAAREVFAALDAHVLEGGLTNDYNAPLVARVLRIEENINTRIDAPELPQVDPLDVPNKIHPDDPDPFRAQPLLFSQRQIDAGVPYPIKTVGQD